MKNKKEKKDWLGAFRHMCLMGLIFISFLAITKPLMVDMVTKIVIGLFIIFGGTGIYIILAVRLEEIKRKYGRKNEKQKRKKTK